MELSLNDLGFQKNFLQWHYYEGIHLWHRKGITSIIVCRMKCKNFCDLISFLRSPVLRQPEKKVNPIEQPNAMICLSSVQVNLQPQSCHLSNQRTMLQEVWNRYLQQNYLINEVVASRLRMALKLDGEIGTSSAVRKMVLIVRQYPFGNNDGMIFSESACGSRRASIVHTILTSLVQLWQKADVLIKIKCCNTPFGHYVKCNWELCYPEMTRRGPSKLRVIFDRSIKSGPYAT